MKASEINIAGLNFHFEGIETPEGQELLKKGKETTFSFDNSLGKAEISGIQFKGNISYISIALDLSVDVVAIQKPAALHPIYFGYCSDGEMLHNFQGGAKTKEVQKFQTGIFSNDTPNPSVFRFPKGRVHQISLIVVNTREAIRAKEKNTQLNHELQQIFEEKHMDGQFRYVSSFNLKIHEKINQLTAVSQKGIVRQLMMKGMVHVILAMEIQQHTLDAQKAAENRGSLTKREMETIHEISKFIGNYPEIQYSLKYLSKKSGLSPCKLQEGFKLLHGRTVTDFIRNKRVETAEKLIKTTDMNISEIVYTIGLASRSYFSKIFKAKYNCSPKYYQEHQNTLAVTA